MDVGGGRAQLTWLGSQQLSHLNQGFSCFQQRSGLFSLSSSNRRVCACADTRTPPILLVNDGSPYGGESRRSPLQRQWWDPRGQRIS
jgi:hypothetical protein